MKNKGSQRRTHGSYLQGLTVCALTPQLHVPCQVRMSHDCMRCACCSAKKPSPNRRHGRRRWLLPPLSLVGIAAVHRRAQRRVPSGNAKTHSTPSHDDSVLAALVRWPHLARDFIPYVDFPLLLYSLLQHRLWRRINHTICTPASPSASLARGDVRDRCGVTIHVCANIREAQRRHLTEMHRRGSPGTFVARGIGCTRDLWLGPEQTQPSNTLVLHIEF